jgi:hypothetical protein
MYPPFDIFKIDPRGLLLWCEAREDLIAAEASVRRLIMSSPADYIILDQTTGHRILIHPNGTAKTISVQAA